MPARLVSEIQEVPDEFPTLEVALAASVVVLVWRAWLLHRSRTQFRAASERLFLAFEQGTPSARDLAKARLGPLLEPLARGAALFAQLEDTERAIGERAARVRRQVRSGAAKDLVICAVLGGSLVYALISETMVSWIFHVLGVTAALLSLAAAGERVRLDREIAEVAGRFKAVQGRPNLEASRELMTCSACGEPELERLSSPDLGARLREMGTRELLICGACGNVSGRSTPTIRR